MPSTSSTFRPCEAKDPSSCRFHGQVANLEKAMEQATAAADMESYFSARTALEELQQSPHDESFGSVDSQATSKKTFDVFGYDEDGFNKDGFDVDGYDAEGFNKQGWGKDGYHENGTDAVSGGFTRQENAYFARFEEAFKQPDPLRAFNLMTPNEEQTDAFVAWASPSRDAISSWAIGRQILSTTTNEALAAAYAENGDLTLYSALATNPHLTRETVRVLEEQSEGYNKPEILEALINAGHLVEDDDE